MRECCQDENNLYVDPNEEQTEVREVLVCAECGAKHYTVTIDPAELGLASK